MSKNIYIVRKEHFNAAHRLRRTDWSDEKNELVFGKCANQNWHGHNFNLIVTVKGIPSPETGFVINLTTLSAIIKKEVIEVFDHKNLNEDLPYFKNGLASTENLAIVIWDILEAPIKNEGGELAKIRLEETENNFVEYFGGKEPY
jgi:6-pyruvoyltetrahydropterin/6-carboxytetrahydropterin synthase